MERRKIKRSNKDPNTKCSETFNNVSKNYLINWESVLTCETILIGSSDCFSQWNLYIFTVFAILKLVYLFSIPSKCMHAFSKQQITYKTQNLSSYICATLSSFDCELSESLTVQQFKNFICNIKSTAKFTNLRYYIPNYTPFKDSLAFENNNNMKLKSCYYLKTINKHYMKKKLVEFFNIVNAQ